MTDASRPDQPALTVTPNGPYLVSGDARIARRRMVASEHGEPMTWQTTDVLAARRALCRCGHSGAKPFCDGSHGREGFQAAEPAAPSRYDDRQATYQATGVVMRDDRSICAHAGFCGNKATNVWEMMGGDATGDSTARAHLMAMIEHCPSGALTFRLEPEGPDIEADLAAEVGVVDDGPLFVTGRVRVRDVDGTELEVRNRVTLCRCGSSANKPYCDGTHQKVGFKDPA
jgi:CDGSH-type Zn-finger protein